MRKIAVSFIALVAISLSTALLAESITDLYKETGSEAMDALLLYEATLSRGTRDATVSFDPTNYEESNGSTMADIEKFETPGFYTIEDLTSTTPPVGDFKYHEYYKNNQIKYTVVNEGPTFLNTQRDKNTYSNFNTNTIGYDINKVNTPISLGQYIVTVGTQSTADSGGYASLYLPHNFLTYQLSFAGGDYRNAIVGTDTNVGYAFYWHKDGNEGAIEGANGSYWGTQAVVQADDWFNSGIFEEYREGGYEIELRMYDNGTNTTNSVVHTNVLFQAATTIGDSYQP